jgi:anti-anti-sigma factor
MEISQQQQADGWVELRVKGRLDSYWADLLRTALDDLIRAGTAKIRLNLAGVSYLSSAGIGTLVRCHKELESIRGKLVLTNPSEPVKEVLHVARLTTLLATETGPRRDQATTVAAGRRVHRSGLTFEVFGQAAGTRLTCRLIGDPGRLHGCRFGPHDCHKVEIPANGLGLGLGALGRDFQDCQERFGEFLAAAGAVAYLPTDGTNVPDYLVAVDDAVAELQVVYGLQCDGSLEGFARFEVDADVGRVPLSRLVQEYLDLAQTDRLALVFLAETSGLMGAALRRSLAREATEGAPFTFPQVRDWLSFTAERACSHTMTLVVGVALRGDAGLLAPLVRPLGKDAALQGHFHAAAFSYRPLSRGEFELRPAVATLFEQQNLQTILHLLADQRDAVGLGESEFVRGACWFGPIADVVEHTASGVA